MIEIMCFYMHFEGFNSRNSLINSGFSFLIINYKYLPVSLTFWTLLLNICQKECKYLSRKSRIQLCFDSNRNKSELKASLRVDRAIGLAASTLFFI